MTRQRLRDMAIGFLLCLAFVATYHCGASSPNEANASPLATGKFQVATSTWESSLGSTRIYLTVIDTKTGELVLQQKYRDGDYPYGE